MLLAFLVLKKKKKKACFFHKKKYLDQFVFYPDIIEQNYSGIFFRNFFVGFLWFGLFGFFLEKSSFWILHDSRKNIPHNLNINSSFSWSHPFGLATVHCSECGFSTAY